MRIDHEPYMRRCIELARRALATSDTPVGSIVVRDGEVLAEGVEAVRARKDVTAHAEIEALRAAFVRLGSVDLTGCTLYTSVEPCVMCAYAIRLARMASVVSGAASAESLSPMSGRMVLTDARMLPTKPVPALVSGVLARECQTLLR